jgi:hypothetical protein
VPPNLPQHPTGRSAWRGAPRVSGMVFGGRSACLGFEPHLAPGQREGFSWWQDEPHGWVNNSPYSRRNPSLLHGYQLDAGGFARVARCDATLGLRRG